MDTTFIRLIDDLQQTSAEQADASLSRGARQWQHPSDIRRRKISSLEVDRLHTPAFDRDDLNRLYERLHASPQPVGRVMACSQQIAFVSMAERAYRLRHASLVRCVTHTGARDEGLAHANGSLAAVRNHVQDLEASAQGGGG